MTTIRLQLQQAGGLMFLILAPVLAYAGDDFAWAPITSADWAVAPDSSRGGMHAIMIFEKIISNDRGFEKGKFYLEVYRRIKVFTPEGRSFAEVSLPYVRKKEEIEELNARTVLPGGKEINLDEDQIHESEAVKTEDVRIMQKSFSFPGVTDGSILEYRYVQRSSSPHNNWYIEKTIPLLQGEFTWKFINRVSNPYMLSFYRMMDIQPNYIWLNCTNTWHVEPLPSKEDPEEVRFTMLDVPAFRPEPYALADEAVKSQLLCYYGKSSNTKEYWQKVSDDTDGSIAEFIDDKDMLKEIVEKLGFPSFTARKIDEAYKWVTKNIRHVSTFADEDEVKTNKHLSDVIERGYGTTEDINILFYALLRQMHVDSRMIYMMDHSRGRFVKEAKFWQFDCSGVHVIAEGGTNLYFAPGYRFMPPGLVPWYVEGTLGLFVGHPATQFIPIPPSGPETNRIQRDLNLQLNEDLSLQGQMKDAREGQAARSLRLAISKLEGTAREEKIREDLKDFCPGGEVDSVSIADVDSTSGSCRLQGLVKLPAVEKSSPHKVMLHPFAMLATGKNPFTARERKNPIVMQYAYMKTERMSIALPGAWIVEAVPKPRKFSNQIGELEVKAEVAGNSLTVERTMILNRAFWPESFYKEIKALYQEYEKLSDVTAVLASK